jgi:tRNA-splicing ligase RtcB (3'-phosphate/5'-hydroxy nucleic acid ligase)
MDSMKYIEEDNALVIKSWCENPENGALEQAKNLARLPFAFKQICLMPDTHQGYGMPIGGVLATSEVVVPNAVGVDIGCGMCATKTSLHELERETLKSIVSEIRKQIPVGFDHQPRKQDEVLMPHFLGEMPVVSREYENALFQIGTLGGGNHFIEIQKGNDGYLWIMIHSGSRNIGKQVAEHYNKVALEIREKYFSTIPKEWGLASLPLDGASGKQYMQEMNYCVEFAFANRKYMMEKITEIIGTRTPATFDPLINIAHNYARMENHFGKNVLIHRKGATSARNGEIGIIPGSQGTSSYIVRGKGNSESFESCSHGAGRKMGRKEAQRTLNLADEQSKLDRRGILHAIRGVHNLDEASGAYKDIETVMKEQNDLVEPIVQLEPLAVVKG